VGVRRPDPGVPAPGGGEYEAVRESRGGETGKLRPPAELRRRVRGRHRRTRRHVRIKNGGPSAHPGWCDPQRARSAE